MSLVSNGDEDGGSENVESEDIVRWPLSGHSPTTQKSPSTHHRTLAHPVNTTHRRLRLHHHLCEALTGSLTPHPPVSLPNMSPPRLSTWLVLWLLCLLCSVGWLSSLPLASAADDVTPLDVEKAMTVSYYDLFSIDAASTAKEIKKASVPLPPPTHALTNFTLHPLSSLLSLPL